VLDPDISTADALRLLTVPDHDPMRMGRRKFLQLVGMGVGAGALAGPLGSMGQGWAAPVGPTDGIVVLVGLFGGVDGLNVVVPYTNADYYAQHGDIAIAPSQALHLNGSVGLHPRLAYLKSLYDQGDVAVVQGVGYPNPDLSHFSSMATWMHGKVGVDSPANGWIGRWMDGLASDDLLRAVSVGQGLPLHLVGDARRGIAVPEWGAGFGGGTDQHDRWMHTAMRAFAGAPGSNGAWHDRVAGTVRDLIDVSQKVSPAFDRPLPDGSLQKKLTIAARLINANLGLRVLDVGFDGFDTHANQPTALADLMADLDNGVKAFFTTLDDSFRSRVTIMTYSEFGRTSWSNDSSGTDHGTVNNHFVIGRGVKGGMYGQQPSLVGLDRWDRMGFHVDFRSLYATVLDGWMGGGASTVLGGSFPKLGFFDQAPGVGVATGSVPARAAGDWVAVTPTRIYDTRIAPRLLPLGPGATGEFRVTGVGGVPATGVTAVALNVTASSGTEVSSLTVWPAGAVRPDIADVAVPRGGSVASLVTVSPGRGGRVRVMNDLGAAQCTIDVVGYFRSTAAPRLAPVTSFRLLDTRTGKGGHLGVLGAGASARVKVRGVGTVPATADSVVVSVTASAPTAYGSVTVWPSGRTRPTVPSVAFAAGAATTNLAVVKVGSDGCLMVRNATGAVHVNIDVLGHFTTGARGRFTPVPAWRVLDTTTDAVAPLGPGEARVVTVTAGHGVPATGVSAVLVHLAAHTPTLDTSLVAYPYATTRPGVTNLSVRKGGHASTLALVKVGAGGRVTLRNALGTVDVVADVVGWFTS
jgi:uncharacterized protein (DUF1501 family)